MAERTLAAIFGVLAVVLISPVAGASLPDPASPIVSLASVPYPAVEDLEPAVREQMKALRSRLEQALGAQPRDPVALAAAFGEGGAVYLLYRLHDAAAACFANAALLAPRDFRWPYMLGVTRQEAGDLAPAAEALASALAIDGAYAAAHLRLAEIELARNRVEIAEAGFRRALGAQGTEAAARFGLGRIEAARQEHEVAVEHFEAALALAPSASAVHYPLALALRQLGRSEEAKRHLELRGEAGVPFADPLVRQLESARRGATVHLERASFALRDGNLDLAATEFRAALAIDAANPQALLGLGRVLAGKGDLEGAEAAYRELLSGEPGHGIAHAELGEILLGEGAAAEARTHLERAIQLSPDLANAHAAYGTVLAQEGRFAEAAAAFALALKLAPTAPALHLARARALLRAGEEQQAATAIAESLAALPDDGDVAHLAARFLATASDPKLRDGAGAFELAVKVFSARPVPEHGETLAMAFAEGGRFDDAVELQRTVVAQLTRTGAAASILDRAKKRLDLYLARQPCRSPWLELPNR